MNFLILKTIDPYLNLAIEEYLFEYSDEDIFMLWQNEPTVVIGKNQNALAEINMNYLKENNIHIARRITGGGAVYHDLGNINYTFISSKNNSNEINFEYYTRPIIKALNNLGINAKLSGRNDLLVGDKKFSGSAQHAKSGRVLHHGTLLFDSDLNVLTNVLNVDEEKIKSKAIKSTRSRVINLKELLDNSFTPEKFIDYISAYINSTFSPKTVSAPMNDTVIALASRNRSDNWLFSSSKLVSNYSTRKKIRYPFGIVDIFIQISDKIIKNINIFGDFFGTSDIKKLEQEISGMYIDKVYEKIYSLKIEEYISGMNSDYLIEHIKSMLEQ